MELSLSALACTQLSSSDQQPDQPLPSYRIL